MKATELRVGNFVSLYGSRATIIPNDFQKWFQNEAHWENNAFKPIPLDEKWLLKFGFEKSDLIGFNGGWQRGTDSKYYIQQMSNAITIHLITEESVALLTGFHFVHQLQNLYFALTGEELTINKEL